MAEQVLLYDTTLRDGMQGEGMSLSADEKVRVAHALDDLGVHLIEAGFPSSNPKEEALFELLAGESFAHAEIAAFGMTRRKDVAAGDDPALRLLADCFAPVCTLVGKTWSLHLEKVTRVDPEKNLRMIADSVAFLCERGKRVIYDAEHFFDAYVDDPDYALRCLRAAADAGAENLTLCDTNGATLPTAIADATAAAVAALGGDVQIGIHAHDDAGCGVANSLVAVERGARLVQGTVNGYGERCGNANLMTILADLQLKLGYDCVEPRQLELLTETAHLIDELCNVAPNPNQPYVGANAFAHKGGMHVAGVNRDARTFEHVEPREVGADRRLLISELSGKGTVEARAEKTGVALTPEGAARVAARVKDLEHRGYHLEAADGSFDLLIREEAGGYEPLFRLESWRVIVEKRADEIGAQTPSASAGGKVQTEATIKIWVDGERYVRTAEGNGPVNALDVALRDAICETYPHLRDIDLVNFKVRILDEDKGTGAVTRVLLDAGDGKETWGTIGVSENIIEASWEALVDSLEAGMLPGRAERVRGGARTAARPGADSPERVQGESGSGVASP
jgi:2-isopropylmalate synthase